MPGDGVVELAGWKARRGGSSGVSADPTPLELLSSGIPGGVEACLDAYAPMVQALARRLLPAGSDVEDVVQEIFVELWRTADRFDGSKASDRGFVAMVARRRIIDRRRRMEARPATESLPERDVYAGTDHERTLGRVLAAPAMDALRTLDAEWQRWIVMNVVEGYSHGEIARSTGTPLGTVKTGIRRGLQRMRDWMEQRGAQEAAR